MSKQSKKHSHTEGGPAWGPGSEQTIFLEAQRPLPLQGSHDPPLRILLLRQRRRLEDRDRTVQRNSGIPKMETNIPGSPQSRRLSRRFLLKSAPIFSLLPKRMLTRMERRISRDPPIRVITRAAKRAVTHIQKKGSKRAFVPKTGSVTGPTAYQPKAQFFRDKPESSIRASMGHKSTMVNSTQKGVRKVVETDMAEEKRPTRNFLDIPVKKPDTKLSPKVVTTL